MKATTIALVIALSFTLSCNVVKGFDNTSITVRKTADHENYRAVAEKFKYLEKNTQDATNWVFKKIMPFIMKYSENAKLNVSQECMKNGLALMAGVQNIKAWAFKFLDASGKIPDDLMIGSIAAMGHYDQCLGIEVKSTSRKNFGQKLFQGQYCVIEVRSLMYVKKPKTIYMLDFPPAIKKYIGTDSIFARTAKFIYYAHLAGIQIGLCVPSGCSKEDLNSVLHTVFDNPHFTVSAISCEIKEENTYSTSLILVLIFYALLILLVLVGSGVDYYISHNNVVVKSRAIQALLAFSLFTNFRRFCAPSHSSDNIQCLNGMKFLGLTYIILGHSIACGFGSFIQGILKYEPLIEGMPFQAMLNALISVDTFFVIGAFLVSYLTTKHVILGKKKFNVLFFVVHRLMRIYPVYIVILTTSAIIPLISSGPWYKEISGVIVGSCYRNWWQNLLFITNFYDPVETCFLHTWYLTTDVQLYVLSLIVILPLIRWPKIGLTLIFLVITGSILHTLIVTYINEWPPAMIFSLMDFDESYEFLRYVYFVPWTRFGPYAIGLLTGYIYAMNPNVKMSRLTQVIGWCIAFTCSFSVLYGTRDWYRGPMPRYLAAIYSGFCRTAWSVGPAWIAYVCSTGHGGIINWILSWRIFTHLGRLTFCGYMIHLIPITVIYSSIRTRVQADVYLSVWTFFGVLSTSLAFALILHLFVEIPFANLERVFFLSANKETENTEKGKNTVEEEVKAEKNGSIIILTPSLKDSLTPSITDSSTRL